MKTYQVIIKEIGGRRLAHGYMRGIKELRAFARMPLRSYWFDGHDGPIYYMGLDKENNLECLAQEVK